MFRELLLKVKYYASTALSTFLFMAFVIAALSLLYTAFFTGLTVDMFRELADKPAIMGGYVGGVVGATFAVLELALSLWKDYRSQRDHETKIRIAQLLPSPGVAGELFTQIAAKQSQVDLSLPSSQLRRRLYALILEGRVTSQYDLTARDYRYGLR